MSIQVLLYYWSHKPCYYMRSLIKTNCFLFSAKSRGDGDSSGNQINIYILRVKTTQGK